MGQRFAVLGVESIPVAYYDTAIVAAEAIPEGAVTISDETYFALRAVKGRRLVDGVVLEPVIDPVAAMGAVRDQLAAAVQAHVDDGARARGYGSGVLLASYAASTNPAWAAEAAAFIAWRDEVWLACYDLMANVQAGLAPVPSLEDLIAALPVIEWPA